MSNPFFSNSLKANVSMPEEANSNSPAPRDLGTPVRQSRLADFGQQNNININIMNGGAAAKAANFGSMIYDSNKKVSKPNKDEYKQLKQAVSLSPTRLLNSIGEQNSNN